MPYPLQFEPILKPRVWGGHRLDAGSAAAGRPIGESWLVADLDGVDEGRSRVRNGPWEGRELRALLDEHEDAILGDARRGPNGGFPLLVKLLDARENLSVQLHPSPGYARTHADALVKTEAWYVIAADEDARIYCGLRDGADPARAMAALGTDEIIAHVNVRPARAGDCHELPSGTIHALGGGCFVAEVQTPSDTTFRVWDWNRSGRAMHVAEARACDSLAQRAPAAVHADDHELSAGAVRHAPLVDNAAFRIERIRTERATRFEVVTDDVPVVLIMIDGPAGVGATITGGGHTVEMAPLTSSLVPARCAATIEVAAHATVLQAAPATARRGAIA